MKVRVNFRQKRFFGSVYKEIELAIDPQIGMHFEYEKDWALATVTSISVGKDWIEIDQYYPLFDEEELEQLQKLGWTVRR